MVCHVSHGVIVMLVNQPVHCYCYDYYIVNELTIESVLSLTVIKTIVLSFSRTLCKSLIIIC